MRKMLKRRKTIRAKSKLGLPDLEHAKSAELVSLQSPESQRSYRRSIEDFACWYCYEPRLSLNATVVTRYRVHLEEKLLAPALLTCGLLQFGDWPKRRPIPNCSVLVWPLGYA
jgi:hypothetical protein